MSAATASVAAASCRNSVSYDPVASKALPIRKGCRDHVPAHPEVGVHVLLRPHGVHRVGMSLPKAAARDRDPGRERGHARLQQPELREVAAVERQVHQLAAGDDAPERGAGGLDRQRAARHGHDLAHRRQGEPHLEADLWLTLTCTPSRTTVGNGGASTTTTYSPTGSNTTR